MKLGTRFIVATLAALSLSATAFAFSGGHCGSQMGGDRMEKNAASRLEKLHSELKLAPEQEQAWKTWSASLQAKFSTMQKNRPDRDAMARLSAPERMEQVLDRMKSHEKELEAELASLRSFYGVLTPEQKQTLDKFRPFNQGGREGGKRKE